MIEEYIKKSKATFYRNFRVKNLIKNVPPAKSALNNFSFLEMSLFMNIALPLISIIIINIHILI